MERFQIIFRVTAKELITDVIVPCLEMLTSILMLAFS